MRLVFACCLLLCFQAYALRVPTENDPAALTPNDLPSNFMPVEALSASATSLEAATTPASTASVAIRDFHIPSAATVLMGASQLPGSSVFSFSWWMKPLGTVTNWASILHRGEADLTRLPGVFFNPGTSKVHCRISTVSDLNAGFDATSDIPLNQWTHVAVVVDSTQMTLYLNSTSVGSVSYFKNAVIAKQATLWSADPWYPAANVVMADLKYHPVALTTSDLSQMFSTFSTNINAPQFQLISSQFTPRVNTQIATVADSSSKEYTYTFWLKVQATQPNWSNIFHKGQTDAVRTPAIFLYANTARLYCRAGTASNPDGGVDSTKSLNLNQWYHVAFVISSAKISLYLDGVLDVEGAIPANTAVTAGANVFGSDNFYLPSKAIVTDLRAYTTALSAANIANVRSQVPVWSSPVSLYTLLAKSVTPKANTVLLKDIQITTNNVYSYTFWVRPTATTKGYGSIFHHGANDQQRNPALWFLPGSTALTVVASTAGDWNSRVDATQALPLNAWTHVAVVVSQSKLQVYLNGVASASVSFASGTAVTTSAPLYVGDPWYEPAAATIADLRYYFFDLSANHVSDIATQTAFLA